MVVAVAHRPECALGFFAIPIAQARPREIRTLGIGFSAACGILWILGCVGLQLGSVYICICIHINYTRVDRKFSTAATRAEATRANETLHAFVYVMRATGDRPPPDTSAVPTTRYTEEPSPRVLLFFLFSPIS